MKLSDLIKDLDHFELRATSDPEIISVDYNSSEVKKGSLFCAIKGERFDGNAFIKTAIENGAVAVLSDSFKEVEVPQIVVETSQMRSAMNKLARRLWGYPDKELKVVGVTGTNGKTSVTKYFESIINYAGHRCLTIGTLNNLRTTPEGPDLFKLMASAVAQNYDFCALEVSSHGLKQQRVSSLEFVSVAFTNITQDHLDYHVTMEDYFESKKLLFYPGVAQRAVVFDSNDYSKRLIEFIKSNGSPQLKVLNTDQISPIEFEDFYTTFIFRGHKVRLKSAGLFSAINAYIAIELAEDFIDDENTLVAGVQAVEAIEGRFEMIRHNNNLGTVIIDYAHTPDALKSAIESARKLAQAEVIVVFGCGGNRDKEKRPIMGKIASMGADLVIITSDNPREEDPEEIIADILSGISTQEAMVCVEPDRKKAIKRAILASRPGDVVLIAGKGHEKYQEIKGERIPFDDKAIANEVLSSSSRCA